MQVQAQAYLDWVWMCSHWSGMGLTSTNGVIRGLDLLIKAAACGSQALLFGSLPSFTIPVAVWDHPSGTMAKEMILLWGSGSPPCWRVMIALEEKELSGYNNKRLSFENMEHKSKEVMDINPRGQVNSRFPSCFCFFLTYNFSNMSLCLQLPAFKYGDKVLNESYAACIFLEVRTSLAKKFMLSLKELTAGRLAEAPAEKKPEICARSHNICLFFF